MSPLSPADGDTIGDVILRRYSRRDMMRGTLGVAAAAALFGPPLLAADPPRAEAHAGPLRNSTRSRPASTAPTTSPKVIGRTCCSVGAIRCFPIPRPSIRSGRALPRN